MVVNLPQALYDTTGPNLQQMHGDAVVSQVPEENTQDVLEAAIDRANELWKLLTSEDLAFNE
jgi:hypothetical protein